MERRDRSGRRKSRRNVLEMDGPAGRNALRTDRRTGDERSGDALGPGKTRLALGCHLAGIQSTGSPMGIWPGFFRHRCKNQKNFLALPRRGTYRQPCPVHEQRPRLSVPLRRLFDLPGCALGQKTVAQDPGERERVVHRHRRLSASPGMGDQLALAQLCDVQR
ncbi:MAG: hypothetical protein BWY83_03020 [bacterium ADurb.Bin478]|nr:MAG: hypothetical protein BWY83_03020 [bacterium ADurb.Bin478]